MQPVYRRDFFTTVLSVLWFSEEAMEELRSKGTVHPEGFIEVTGPGAKEIAERIRLAPGAAEAGTVRICSVVGGLTWN